MKKLILSIVCVLFAPSVFAADFCSRSRDDLLTAFHQPENRIAFNNRGGLLGSGVCWWHSRLQRSSLYLSVFKPEKAKPTKLEAIQIIRNLTHLRSVVEIPGYSNFLDFSTDFQDEIQRELNRWMARDSFINQTWIPGVTQKANLSADEMKTRMDSIHQEFLNAPAGLWVMAQLKGIVAHSILIIGMRQLSNGYEITGIDSNHADSNRTYTYHHGDDSIYLGGFMKAYYFVPYVGFNDDFKKIEAALGEFCGS